MRTKSGKGEDREKVVYMRGDNNLKELEDTLAGEKKKLNHVIEVKESFEIFMKEERELIETVNESTRRSTTFQTESEERNKRLKLKKQKNAELKAILKEMEEEAAIKEAHHDKQMYNSQKAKELELLQTIFVDLEEKKDEIQMQLMNKTLEVKEVISKINEMVTKIKLSSSLEINEFPQFDILDFNKKNDLIEQYKESLISIRIEYNENMCKLPEELIQCQEKRKLMESKIAAFDVEISTIEAKIQSEENYFRKIREESENLTLALSEEMNENVHGLTDLETAIKQVDALIIKLGQTEENQKRIRLDDQIQEIKLVQESYVNTEKHFQEKLEIFEKECVENINGKSTLLCESK